MRKFSKLARSARSHIHRISSMLFFCRYFVVYSAIPQVIKVTCIDCICIYRCVDVFMYLRDFSRFFHTHTKKNYADPVLVYVMLYVIILIQILIRYNVKNLITACTRSLDFDLKIEKSPYPGRGNTYPPLPDPPPARSLRSLGLGRSAPSHLSLFHSVPPPPPPNALTHGTPLGYPLPPTVRTFWKFGCYDSGVFLCIVKYKLTSILAENV